MTTVGEPRIGSLFSGYGGLDLAVLSVLGGRVAWHCEVDPAAARVLAHHWPDVPNLGDITAVHWDQVEPVDVLTGGFPCQDVSSAGRRAGIAPGTRSGLWAHMAGAIDALRPPLVVIENVRGLLSAPAASDVEPCPWCVGNRPENSLRALGAVLGDLADLGYDARWCGLRAADVGAPHPRYRIFIVAAQNTRQPVPRQAQDDRTPANTDSIRRPQGPHGPRKAQTAGTPNQPERRGTALVDWGPYSLAITRWERLLNRPAPVPTVAGPRGGQRLNPHFVEWLMGLPPGHVTDVPGLSYSEQLRLLGNGVVPQQGAAALTRLLPLLRDQEDDY